jgi:protocatechuate 4,5-dioxygenase alpha chain
MDHPGFDHHTHIPGTTVFDGHMAMKGYALNKMCFAFNKLENREAFLADEEAFMDRYGQNDDHKAAVRARDILGMIAAGGNIYYLAKLAGVFKLSVQDVGAMQTGMTADAFRQKLLDAGKT